MSKDDKPSSRGDGLICDNCHADAEEGDKECWSCGHTTFVYEPGNAKPTPSATTKTLEEILILLVSKVNSNGMRLNTVRDALKAPYFTEALAAINNYTTQRVIEELEKLKIKYGGWSSQNMLLGKEMVANIEERMQELKGGIDE